MQSFCLGRFEWSRNRWEERSLEDQIIYSECKAVISTQVNALYICTIDNRNIIILLCYIIIIIRNDSNIIIRTLRGENCSYSWLKSDLSILCYTLSVEEAERFCLVGPFSILIFGNGLGGTSKPNSFKSKWSSPSLRIRSCPIFDEFAARALNISK